MTPSAGITDEEHRRISKLYIDMYEGDGVENPPMTTRMDRVERATASMNRLTWALVVVALTVIGDIISQHLKF